MLRVVLLMLAGFLPNFCAEFSFDFDRGQQRWRLSNGIVEAKFRLTSSGTFEFEQFDHLQNGFGWRASDTVKSSPIRFAIDDTIIDAHSAFSLQNEYSEGIGRGGRRQVIQLSDVGGRFLLELHLEMYDGQAVLRHSVQVINQLGRRVWMRMADMLPYAFAAPEESYRILRVNQWSVAPVEQNFEPLQARLNPAGGAVWVRSGARGLQCSWLALRDPADRGMFAGWEFDGRADATVRHRAVQLSMQFAAPVLDLYHPVDPGAPFQVPAAFIGLFSGDWDEAGYRTQRFIEAALALPNPDPAFPYVAWDSWGYQDRIDEQQLRSEAEVAAKLGVELFVVDLGWATRLGDWHPDPAKFPSGLRALSDYVHSLGMKFGLHFALTEAAPDSSVLALHPEWTSSETYGYFGALSLCLGHQPVQDWLVGEALRIIDEYNVDWILQDGENMVKLCTREDHTHDPRDSNYSNSVNGINAVLRAIQQARPSVLWENCEDGGNMMTFNMVRHYVTSITNDANGSLGARQAVWGATYPFPPRYADRYMIENELGPYVTRSHIFGGPWIFMNKLLDLSPEELDFAASEVRLFKAIRGKVRDGKVYRLTDRPEEGRVDAIQAYHAESDSAVAVVTRDGSASARFMLRLRGLNPEATYRVRFQDDPRSMALTGAQLMNQGIAVNLRDVETAEVVHIDPM